MEDLKKIEAIVSLLLNRTKSHKWMYFDIVFNAVNPNENPTLLSEIDTLLTDVEVILPQPFDDGDEQDTENKPAITSELMYDLVEYIRNNNTILQEVIHRIFDMNLILTDSNIVESAKTSAFSGNLLKLNKSETEHRRANFYKKLQENPNFRNDPGNIVALAEGDSWFQFPKIFLGLRFLGMDVVKDIVDHLNDDKESPNYCVYSLAAGGDWLQNMLNETTQDYIENLTKILPDVFLVSGGGNDLVDDKRLAHMVRDLPREGRRKLSSNDPKWVNRKLYKLLELRKNEAEKSNNFDAEKYERGLCLVSDDFFRFINVCFVQYFTLFYRLLKTTGKFKNMLIITHGYDFGIPSMKKHGGLIHRFVNGIMNTGKWLFTPLVMRGISEPEDQKAVIYFMIYEFNEMLIKLATYKKFYNVFHIDCRGSVSDDEWFDELHPVSDSFKRITDTYKKCIEENIQYIRTLTSDDKHNEEVINKVRGKVYVVKS